MHSVKATPEVASDELNPIDALVELVCAEGDEVTDTDGAVLSTLTVTVEESVVLQIGRAHV